MSKKVYTIKEIKQLLNKFLENMPVYSVVLFGSYVNNTTTQNSNLDLIIDTKEQLLGFKLYSLITKMEELFGKNIDAFEKAEIIKDSKKYKEIQEKGVVVYEK